MVAALLSGCIAALLLSEILLRVYVWSRGWTANCYAADLQLYQPHPVIGSELAPNFRLRSSVHEVSVNAAGFRGPPIAQQKPVGVVRVAMLGGSATYGYLARDQQVAARLLEDELRAKGLDAEVINAGVPGYNLYHTTVRYRERVAPLKPDYVVLYLGWNDLPYVVSDQPRHADFRIKQIAPGWQRLLSHSTLYGFVFYRLRNDRPHMAPPAEVRLKPTSIGSQQLRENLEQLAAEIEASGAQMIVCAQACGAHPEVSDELRLQLDAQERVPAARMVPLAQMLHETLHALAERHQAPFVDAYEAIPPTEENLGDYIHLTPRGERLLAELLAELLTELLAERMQSSPSIIEAS